METYIKLFLLQGQYNIRGNHNEELQRELEYRWLSVQG